MSKGSGGKTAIWVGVGCLGCVGLPVIVLAAGAGGWFLASQKYEAEMAFRDALEADPYDGYDADEPVRGSGDAEVLSIDELMEAAKAARTPAPVATPTATPVIARLTVSTPTPVAVKATPTPVRAVATPVKTPEPVVAKKPVPTSP